MWARAPVAEQRSRSTLAARFHDVGNASDQGTLSRSSVRFNWRQPAVNAALTRVTGDSWVSTIWAPTTARLQNSCSKPMLAAFGPQSRVRQRLLRGDEADPLWRI